MGNANKDMGLISKSISGYSTEELGGKGYSLAILMKHGFQVLDGIILRAGAFERFMRDNGLYDTLAKTESGNYKKKDMVRLSNAVHGGTFPSGFRTQLMKELELLRLSDKKLIVRSSANIEDAKNSSYAGQFNTILGVCKSDLEKAIINVYASIFNNRAVTYSKIKGMPVRQIKMAVVIQEFIDTDFAGVTFTSNPVMGNKDEMIVEYVRGQGENLVSGKKSPTGIVLDKKNLRVKSTYGDDAAGISGSKVLEVARAAQAIARLFSMDMDIEWGIKDDKLLIFQARAITNNGQLHTKNNLGTDPVQGP